MERGRRTLNECQNVARGARKEGHQAAACVRKAQAPVPPLALGGHHVLGLHCMIHREYERAYTASRSGRSPGLIGE
jgi:hypothetical protein